MIIGSRISGRYKVLRMIGGGGMANVYLARDVILDRDVAIKILRMDFANEDEFIRRFQREAQNATSLAHENIVSIYDIGEEKDIYYIVMEYVDGMTLKQYIQQFHPIPLEKTIDIMKQLTSAITHAHQNQIVHRDIKPQNILIDHNGHVMITDFGIALALSATSITQTNSVLGSVHYLSPEQARGGLATKKSDFYSLGIVMFELLTGRLPFSGESAVSIALKHLQSETPFPSRWNPDIPQSVENIVLKATAKDPFIRYESAELMESDLETALDANRLHEPKFVIPEDDDATKAIPVINGEYLKNEQEQTIAHKSEPKNNVAQEQPQKRKKKIWPWIVGGVTALLILAVVFFTNILPAIQSAKNVEIPDISGEEYDEGVLHLVDLGLEVGKVVEANSDDVPEGEIIRTSPRAGKEVKKGSKVDIYLSIGKEKFTLEDYTGRQFDEIAQLLDDKGFKNIRENGKHSDEVEGTILEQSPGPDEAVVPEDTVLTFTVSLGKEKVILRDLTGYNAKGLESYIELSGLSIDMSQEEYHETVPEGEVISQSPAPNTELSKGDKVTVVISKGKDLSPKTVTKNVTIEYEPLNEEGEEAQPQKVNIVIQDLNNDMKVPVEEFEITSTIEKELVFTVEHGKTATYKIMRDDEEYETGTVEYPNE